MHWVQFSFRPSSFKFLEYFSSASVFYFLRIDQFHFITLSKFFDWPSIKWCFHLIPGLLNNCAVNLNPAQNRQNQMLDRKTKIHPKVWKIIFGFREHLIGFGESKGAALHLRLGSLASCSFQFWEMRWEFVPNFWIANRLHFSSSVSIPFSKWAGSIWAALACEANLHSLLDRLLRILIVKLIKSMYWSSSKVSKSYNVKGWIGMNNKIICFFLLWVIKKNIQTAFFSQNGLEILENNPINSGIFEQSELRNSKGGYFLKRPCLIWKSWGHNIVTSKILGSWSLNAWKK